MLVSKGNIFSSVVEGKQSFPNSHLGTMEFSLATSVIPTPLNILKGKLLIRPHTQGFSDIKSITFIFTVMSSELPVKDYAYPFSAN